MRFKYKKDHCVDVNLDGLIISKVIIKREKRNGNNFYILRMRMNTFLAVNESLIIGYTKENIWANEKENEDGKIQNS